MHARPAYHSIATLALGFGALCNPARGQILETETARLPPRAAWELAGNLEYQTSSDGRESAFPWALTYGLRDDWELLVEPVLYTDISPSGAASASGVGDTEITLTHLFHAENGSRMPAFAWAIEAKIPTGQPPLIGTGEYDYTGYFIASKRIGRFDVHGNLSYTLIGAPAQTNLEDYVGVAIGAVFQPRPTYEIFGELLGTSSSGGGDESAGPVPVPEAGGEAAATVGAGRFFRPNMLGFITVGSDGSGASLARLGFNCSFGRVSRR
jgi:hypothetical protein